LAKSRDGGSGSLPDPYKPRLNTWMSLMVPSYYPIFGYSFRKEDLDKIKNVDPLVAPKSSCIIHKDFESLCQQ